jgi:GABA permease
MTDYIQEVPGPGPEPVGLGKTLLPRHVEMISIGGIIGAGLFVGSSAAIARTGPAIVISYLLAGAMIFFVMRWPTSRARRWATGRASPPAGSTGISGWWSWPSRPSPGPC